MRRAHSFFLISAVSVLAALLSYSAQNMLSAQVSGGTCGNGQVDKREMCDDGNANNHDGCSTGCAVLTGWSCSGNRSICHRGCGDGNGDAAYGESCDDGNNADGDGCSRTCQGESGFICEGDPMRCRCIGTGASCRLASCGNRVVEGGELCDDGNTKNGDGCSNGCAVEVGYVCRISNPSICSKDVATLLELLRKYRSGIQ